MKLHKIFLGCAAAMALASCVSEEFPKSNTQEMGTLHIGVEAQQPMKTRGNEALIAVTDFPVTVYDANGKIVKDNLNGNKELSFANSSEIPESILLPAGTYYLESHTPGEMDNIMDKPYYKGIDTTEVIKGEHIHSTIICKMANTSITVILEKKFLDAFTSWTLTLNDGISNDAISFSEDDVKDGKLATIYWKLGENVSTIKVNFTGVTTDGRTITLEEQEIKKEKATMTYNGSSKNFGGGDALEITLSPVAADKGIINIYFDVSIFDLNAEISEAVVELIDNGSGPFEPGDDDNPVNPNPGDDSSITLNLPNNMTVNAATDKSLGDTYIKCDNGIKSIMVTVVSDSEEMNESLEGLNENYGVDFIGGAEIVGNQDVVQLFEDLEKPLNVPSVGDTEYTFPIGNFFGLLGFLSGHHTFNLVVEDMQGNKKNGSLTLTVE